MSGLFVPPEGAMQFEVLRGWKGEPVPEELRPYILWVLPRQPSTEKSQKPDCPHQTNFPVLKVQNPTYIKANRHIGDPRICECVGRIIE